MAPQPKPMPSPMPSPKPMPHPNPPNNFRPDFRRFFPQQYFVINQPIQSTYAQNLANAICGVIYGYNRDFPNPDKTTKDVYNAYVNCVTNIIKAMGYTFSCDNFGNSVSLTSIVIDHNQVASTVCEIQTLLKNYPNSFNGQVINNAVLLSIQNQLMNDMVSHGYTFNPTTCTASLSGPVLIGSYPVTTRYGSVITYNYNRNGVLSGVNY